RQLVAQSSIDFVRIFKQPRIERNEFLAIIRAASRCFEVRIPFDTEVGRDSSRVERAQQLACIFFKGDCTVARVGDPGILEFAKAAGISDPGYSTKPELEAPKQRHTRSFACSGDRQSFAPRLQPLLFRRPLSIYRAKIGLRNARAPSANPLRAKHATQR